MPGGESAAMESVPDSESTPVDGDLVATDQWLLAFYDELRRMAQSMLARESPGQTLQATALVHEAFRPLDRPLPWPRHSGR